jgi:hypothetical protein
MKLRRSHAPLALSVLSAALWAGCGGGDGDGDGDGSGGGSGVGGSQGVGGGLNVGGGTNVQGQPWPAEPVFAADAPANAAELFAGAAAGAACVTEPQDGAMLPKNWLRPRFRVSGAPLAYMVTLSAEQMTNNLVGYAGPAGFSLPAEYWAGIAGYASAGPVTVTATVRAHDGVAFTEATTTFVIAPAEAGGSMVYWASTASADLAQNSKLVGFGVGEEGVVDAALTPGDVPVSDLRREDYTIKDGRGTDPGRVSCIGCHTSTPDGEAVVFNDGWPWAGITASVVEETRGAQPASVTALGARLLQMPFIGTFTFSKASWDAGKRLAVATMTPGEPYGQIRNVATTGDLIWIDLAAAGSADLGADGAAANAAIAALKGTAWGTLARTGDSRAPANPVWSPDGSTVVYASAAQVAGGHVGGLDPNNAVAPDKPLAGATEVDLYSVPFSDGAGGSATPVAGASEAGFAEYYPDYSDDGALLAFNRSGTTGYIYYRADGEVHVVPSAGGAAHRLAANDPPACSGETSPGVINSWPKWAPSSAAVGGTRYYWLIFSSGRAYPEQFALPKDTWTPAELDNRSSQLYLAAVAVAADGTVSSYPAVYIWNQTTGTSNLTPAWDEFKIPPAVVK